MTSRVQENRTATPNAPPANNSLQVGELFVEMATPLRLWTGVPTSVTASGVKLILDSTAQATANAAAVQKTGDTMSGPLVLSGTPTAPSQAASKAYVDTFLPLTGGTLTGPGTLTVNGAAVFGTTLSVTGATTLATATATTPTAGDNSTKVATTAFVSAYATLLSPVFTGNPTAPTPTLGDNDTSIATTAFVAGTIAAGPPAGALIAATPPVATPGTLWFDNTGGQLYVRYDDGNSQQWVPSANLPAGASQSDMALSLNNVGRNKLHNGLFTVAQRGAGPWTVNGYTLDRWSAYVGGSTMSITQVALSDADRTSIGDEAARTCFQCVAAGTAGAGDYVIAAQHAIEDVSRLSGKTAILSFWAKANSGTPKYGIDIYQYFGTGGSPSTTVKCPSQAVTLSTTWTRYTTLWNIPSVAGKTLGTSRDHSTNIQTWMSSGATNNADAGGIGVQSYTLQLWGVQLEIAAPGQTQPSPLEKLDPRMELSNCQRFYQTLPAYLLSGYGPTGVIYTGLSLPQPMRAASSVTFANTSYALNTASLALNSANVNSVRLAYNIVATGFGYLVTDIQLSADL